MKLTAEIQPRPPFDFGTILEYLRTSPSTILEAVDDRSYRRAMRLEEQLVELTVWQADSGSETPLKLEVVGSDLDKNTLARAKSLVERVFDTPRDTTPLAQVAERDPVFGELVAEFPGLRPVMIADPFETLVWAIIGQQVNTAFARKNKLALTEAYGERVEVNGRPYSLFPSPEVLARIAPGELRPLQFSRQKEGYIRGIAQAVSEGRLDFRMLAQQGPERALKELVALRGVGRWTAEYMLLRGLGYTDTIPAADGGLRRIIGLRYLGRSATEEEVRRLSESWRGWRGYAAFYWWLALQKGRA